MKEKLKDYKGFTLVELIIVLAIMAILGAIIVPNFITSTDKARLKSDIQSARVIQSAISLHNAEHSEALPTDMGSTMTALKEKGYIGTSAIEVPQSTGAVWKLDGKGNVLVDITKCDEKVRSQYDKLTVQEQSMVDNGSKANP